MPSTKISALTFSSDEIQAFLIDQGFATARSEEPVTCLLRFTESEESFESDILGQAFPLRVMSVLPLGADGWLCYLALTEDLMPYYLRLERPVLKIPNPTLHQSDRQDIIVFPLENPIYLTGTLSNLEEVTPDLASA